MTLDMTNQSTKCSNSAYIRPTCVLRLGDAMELLSEYEDASFDFILLDPNYNEWDDLCERGLICQCVRLLRPQGNIVCFSKQPFDFNLRNEVNFMIRREIIWSFTNGGAWVSNNLPLVSFQKILWCSPFKKPYFYPRTGERYSNSTKSFKRNSKVFEGYQEDGHVFIPNEDGIWMRDHIHENKPQCGSLPAKPQRLMTILTKCLCKQNGSVLDPFAGSGILAQVCRNLALNYTGFEIDPKRYDAIQRIIAKPQQLTLF